MKTIRIELSYPEPTDEGVFQCPRVMVYVNQVPVGRLQKLDLMLSADQVLPHLAVEQIRLPGWTGLKEQLGELPGVIVEETDVGAV